MGERHMHGSVSRKDDKIKLLVRKVFAEPLPNRRANQLFLREAGSIISLGHLLVMLVLPFVMMQNANISIRMWRLQNCP